MIGIPEAMAFLFAALMFILGGEWGMRYGCFAALGCGIVAALAASRA